MSEWYKDWFESSEYLLLYKHRDDAEAEKLRDLLCSRIKLDPGTTILDIACGSGRHSVVFAEKGYQVTAFDISRNLLKIARGKACSQGIKINLYCADVRNFATKKKFQVILNLFTSFGYFETDCENFRLFENTYNHLKDNGYFIFDYFNVNFLKKNLVPESIINIDGKKIVQKRYFSENKRVNKDIIVTDLIAQKKYKETVRLYSPDEILQKLESTGFSIVETFGNYDGSRFDDQISHRLIVIARK